MGAELVNARACQTWGVWVISCLPKKTEPEGARSGAIRSAPFGSKFGATGHQPKRARTRWLTERIASTGPAREGPIQRTKTQARVRTRIVVEKLRQKRFRKKTGRTTFFYLTDALMADPFSSTSTVLAGPFHLCGTPPVRPCSSMPIFFTPNPVKAVRCAQPNAGSGPIFSSAQ